MYREGGVNSLIFNGLCMVKTAFLGYFRESGVKIFCQILDLFEVEKKVEMSFSAPERSYLGGFPLSTTAARKNVPTFIRKKYPFVVF